MNANPKILVLALAAALAAAAPACGSSDDDDKAKVIDTGGEDCTNGIDDDGDGAVDCSDPNCFAVPECKGCTDQVPTCESDLVGRLNAVCIERSCVPAGKTENGQVVRGSILVYNTLESRLESQAGIHKSYLMELFHPVKPDGSRVTCDELVAAGRDGGSITGVNLVGRSTGRIAQGGTTIPGDAFNMPVPEEGTGFLLLSRLFGSIDASGTPAGELHGIGCLAGVVIPEGDIPETCRTTPDAEECDGRSVEVIIRPVCDPTNDTCPDGKTCQRISFVCRYDQCDDCSALERKTCRELDGAPVCLKECDPANLEQVGCDDGERCDTTPGWKPACIPVE